ncbi:MAG TPA: ABC transporter ATP-binding protein [Sediminispirochaeta sp.]|nr:ABC transporter ATP-binding protein [Sediminispirochaeta sp.]
MKRQKNERSEMRLLCRRLQRSFDDFSLNIDLKASQGEFLCLLGPSGCGKSTTLQLIAGIIKPDAGEIWLGDREITETPPWERRVGLVFQDYALFPHMSVSQNIAYGLKQQGREKTEIKRRVTELLELIRLPAYGDRLPGQLSGGEKQRIALARAIAPEPDLLLLDEPLSALDTGLRTELRREIRRIQRQTGLTTIYVTHDQEEALSLADRIVVLRDGSLEQEGLPQELYHRPVNAFVARFMGNANLIPNPDGERSETYLFFRPEDTYLSSKRGEDSEVYSFQLKINSLEYLGSRYLVEAGNDFFTIKTYVSEEEMNRHQLRSGQKGPWFEVKRSDTKLLK